MRNHRTKVFLYPRDASPGIQEAHTALKSELLAHGYSILPESLVDLEGRALESELGLFLLDDTQDSRIRQLMETFAYRSQRPWVVWESPSAHASKDAMLRMLNAKANRLTSPHRGRYFDASVSAARLKSEVMELLRPETRFVRPPEDPALSEELASAYLPSSLNQAVEFYSCFISYNHVDKPFARRLYDTLQRRGIQCWLDEKHMFPGDDIHDSIDHGIHVWDKVLLVCSKNSLTSGWVDQEIEKAFAKERALMKQREKKVQALIPLDLDGYLFDGWTSGKATQLLSRLVADFIGWESSHAKFEETIERVVGALRSGEHAREKPPVSRL